VSPGSAPPGHTRSRRRGPAWLGWAVVLSAVLVLTLLLVAASDHDGVTRAATRDRRTRAHGRAARTVIAAIAAGATGRPIARSFLGLSTEYWSLPGYESHMRVFGRVLSLLAVRGDGPLVIRVGGNSADHTFWVSQVRSMPRWVFQLTPDWLRAARRLLVARADVRLILDLNLVTDRPGVAMEWARAAEAALPPRSVIGFEIGNEPDIYSRWFWLHRMAATGSDAGSIPRDLTPAAYSHDFTAYARLLHKVAPGTPLLGPAVANPSRHLSWISAVVARERHELGTVSAHRYPYSACVSPASGSYPTVARLLSEKASAGAARSLAPAIAVAHRAGLPFRLTELNSVTCGGLAGVSNTFATALWAPDALFELIRAGVSGVNVHVRTDAVNAAFAMTGDGLAARPLLYGLIAFRRMLGPGATMLPVRLSAKPSAHVKVWAVRDGARIEVLAIDKGADPATVQLRLPANSPATVARLTAPSAVATSHVTLGGQWLGRDGRWRGRRSQESIAASGGGYRFTLGRYSAALLSVSDGAQRSTRPLV
jgi:hypothetical protein